MSNKHIYDRLINSILPQPVPKAPSMEAEVNENEAEFYIQNPDLSFISDKSVSTELQEQWGIFQPQTGKNAGEGSLRVRKTITNGEEPKYEMTGKLFMKDGTKQEYPLEVNADLFSFFEKISEQGMIKTRYHLPITIGEVALTLEVDVPKRMGEEVWVKVDLEIPEGMHMPDRETLKNAIPFSYEGECIIVTPSDKAAKNEVAQKGHELARKLLVVSNQLVGI